MKLTSFITNRRGGLRRALTLTLLTGLAACPNVLAKPGGNGGGKGGGGNDGGGDPPPPPAPVAYQVSWVDLADSTYIEGVNSQGTAVGYARWSGDPSGPTGFLRFVDGEVHDLNDVLSDHLPTDPTTGQPWVIGAGFEITEDFIIAGNMRDPDGGRHAFATKLQDLGPALLPEVLWFQILSGADLGAPVQTEPHGVRVQDAGQNGEVLLQLGGEAWDDGLDRTFVWRPETGLLLDPPIVEGPWIESNNYYSERMNSQSQVVLPPERVVVDTITGLESSVTVGGYPMDIGHDGMLVGIVESTARVKGYGWTTIAAAGRCVDGVWEPITDFWPRGGSSRWLTAAYHVNDAGHIVGFNNGPMFLFVDDGATKLREVEALLDFTGDPDGEAFWNSLSDGFDWNLTSLREISEPDATGFGWICGESYLGSGRRVGFILRPIAAP